MALESISPTKEDFDHCDWMEVIAAAPIKTCTDYCALLESRGQEAEEQGDTSCAHALELLYHVCSLRIVLDSPDKPFAPLMVFRTRRSAIVDDLNEAHLDTLEAVIPEVQDPELRARIADVLWFLGRGGYQTAQIAVDSYLESAETLEDPERWTPCAERIERAAQLAVRLGWENQPFITVIARIEQVLDRHDGEDPLFLSARLMGILLKYRQGDPEKYAALAEKAALDAELAENGIKWHKARTYWETKARWHFLDGDEQAANDARIRAAETFVEEAKAALNRPHTPHSAAAGYQRQALEALRRIPDTQGRRKEIHKELLEYEKQSISEFRPVSIELDVSHIAEAAISMVKGKPLLDAFLALSFATKSPNVTALQQRVEEQAQRYAFTYWTSMHVLDEVGKVKGRRPGLFGDQTEAQIALQAEMFREAAYLQKLIADAVVRNAVAQIREEHSVRVEELLPLVAYSPFVPPGRELIFARGLHAGVMGDFLVANHLLLPQIEQSIRYLLEQRGSIVSGLDDQSIQDEYTLNSIFYRYQSELRAIFGPDLLFDLQGLLIERFGSNMRNLVLHGLVDYVGFYAWQSLYLWWTVLRLCCRWPIYSQVFRGRQAVLTAVSEFDQLGRDSFLSKYGYGYARIYFLKFNGKLYDAKAIIGVTHGYENPEEGPLKPSEFRGGGDTIRRRLEELGFEVHVVSSSKG